MFATPDAPEAPEATPGALTSANGAVPHEDPIITSLQRLIDERKNKVTELRQQLADLEPELRRYEKALALILDEAPPPGRGRPAGAGKPVRPKPSGLSAERIKLVEDAVRQYAANHDEFRQVDIRTVIDVSSGVTALAFEELRQRGVIRLARAEGNNKFFRLTREALRGED